MAAITSQSEPSWLDEHVDLAVDQALAAIDRYGQSTGQKTLFRKILMSALGKDGIERNVCVIALRLPLLVYFALRENADDAIYQLVGALLLLEAGIYTLDHIMDEEVDSALAEVSQRAVLLGAVCFISHLPNQIVLSLSADPALRTSLVGMLADGQARIGAGQLEDIGSNRLQPSSKEIEFAVAMKTGERRALLAGMAATLARGTAEQIVSYEKFGKSLGIARQLRSDLVDLFGPLPSRDLASGTITLPLALYLERENPRNVAEMQRSLTSSSHLHIVQREVCDRLRTSGVMREVARIIEHHCIQALIRLEEAQPLQRAGLVLRALSRAPSLAVG